MNLENISKNLKTLRENSHLSQTELAKKLGISKQAISYYERGLRLPDLHNLIKLSTFFNTSLDSIVFTNSDIDITKLHNIISSDIDKSLLNSFLNNLELSNEINTKLIQFLKISSTNDTIENDINDKNNNPIKHIIENNDNSEYNTEIADELSPVVSLNEYKLNKNSIDVNFYNENNVYIVDASPFSTNETTKVNSYGPVSAGMPMFGENSIDDEFNIFKYDLKYDSDQYFVLKVKGESMNRLYKNGDYLLVKKACDYDFNKPVIVFLEDEATVKFVDIDDDYITIIPYSTESKYEPISYSLKDHKYYIAGSVVGVINIIKND